MSWEKKGTCQYSEQNKLILWVKGQHKILINEYGAASWYIFYVDDKLYNSSLGPRLTNQSDIDKLFNQALANAPERAKNPFK